jgi:hypothetical protein
MLASIDQDARDIAALQEKNKRLESEMHELRTAFSTLSLSMMKELRDLKSSLRDHEDKLLDTNNDLHVYLEGPLTGKKKMFPWMRDERRRLHHKVLAKITFPLDVDEIDFPCDQEFYIVNDEEFAVCVGLNSPNGYGLVFPMDDPAFKSCSLSNDKIMVPAKSTIRLPKARVVFEVKDILDYGRNVIENDTKSLATYEQYRGEKHTLTNYEIRFETTFHVTSMRTDLSPKQFAAPIRLKWRIEVVKPEEIPAPDEIPWEKEIDPLNLVGKHIFYKSGASSEPLSGVVVAYDNSKKMLCINGTEFIDMKFWFISLQSPPNAVWFAPMK